MPWLESLWGKKEKKVNDVASQKNEPTFAVPAAEVAATAKAAELQQEADQREIEVIRARLNGELPASDQEHIDIPLVQEKKENEALKEELKKEWENHQQLIDYVVALSELEEAVRNEDPGELELSQPLFDRAFKKAAAAIKATNLHPDLTERDIMIKLIVGVRYKKLGELIAIGERMREESVQKIKELQGDKTSRIVQEAWRKGGSQEK